MNIDLYSKIEQKFKYELEIFVLKVLILVHALVFLWYNKAELAVLYDRPLPFRPHAMHLFLGESWGEQARLGMVYACVFGA